MVDSISHLDGSARGKIVICGSHGGRAAARYMVSWKPRAVVFNDAGVGKQRAGIRALTILEAHGIPGIAVSANSARIGEGWETFRSGVVSFVNHRARRRGVRPNMTVQVAVKRLAR